MYVFTYIYIIYDIRIYTLSCKVNIFPVSLNSNSECSVLTCMTGKVSDELIVVR